MCLIWGGAIPGQAVKHCLCLCVGVCVTAYYCREEDDSPQVELNFLGKHLQTIDHHKTITSLHYNIDSPSFSLLEQLCHCEGAGHARAIGGQFHVVGMATLLLSAVQRRFGHQREAANCLREAIMLAHEEQLSDILDYAVVCCVCVRVFVCVCVYVYVYLCVCVHVCVWCCETACK